MADQDDVAIGARLRTLRRQRSMSQAALGRALGISLQQIQKYESGQNRISASRLHMIALLLGIDLAYFFYDEKVDGQATDQESLPSVATAGEGLALNRAFGRIRSQRWRAAVLSLLIALADEQD